ncbi:hypothetical protein D0861_08564 [Hortaea werneckii]|uniref:Myb-like domain-containing protein n=1 Tax=Hortaea werneckii TaxID=91943 RepID=A0A3M7EW79_HORWE|nr:hypothetical protein D0861_08564 [Hortaea werneckii]
MAKLSSTARPPSRQPSAAPSDPPATAPPPGRTTRSTRSQSREPSAQPAEPIEAPATKKRGGKKTKAAQQDLETVAEHEADEAQNQEDVAAAEEDAAAADEIIERPRSSNSALSRMTAKTSFSQEEIADLDPDIMVDVLPNLVAAADQLCALLFPADPKQRPVVWQEIHIEGSRHRKLLNNRLSSFLLHKNNFGSQEYIQPSIVLRALLSVSSIDQVSDGPWRPDDLLYKINLAQMMRTVLDTVIDPTELDAARYESFDKLIQAFPTAIAGHGFSSEAMRTCLALQTQLSVARLHVFHSHPEYDPTSVVDSVFFKRNEDGEYVHAYHEHLNLDELDPLELERWTQEINALVAALQAPFQDANKDLMVALADIREEFPWQSFVNQAANFYELRKADINMAINKAGGVDAVVASLAQEVERRGFDRLAAEKRQSFGKSAGTPRKGYKGIAALKAREQRLSTQAAPNQPFQATAPVAPMMDPRLTQAPGLSTFTQDDGYAPLPEDDYNGQPTIQEPAQSDLQHLAGFRNMQMQNAKRKQKSFLDRQEGAHRIAWDDASQPLPGEAGAASSMPARSSASGPYHVGNARGSKRPYDGVDNDIDDFDPTQDEGFQTDMRDTSAADARRRSAPRPDARRPPQTVNRSGTVEYEYPGSQSASPSKRQRKNPGSTIPHTLPPLDPEAGPIPPEQHYQRAKIAAKQGRIIASSQKPQQVRTPWSDEEENAMVDLIRRHGGEGVSYAALKKWDTEENGGQGILWRRSAEDIRFKARNMKQTFIL